MIFALSISLLMLTLLVLVMYIASRGTRLHGWFVYLVIPFLLFNIGFSWHTVNEVLGQATTRYPSGKFDIMAVSKGQGYVYLVVKEQDRDEPTFHQLPDTEENKKEAERTERLLKKNIRMQGEVVENQNKAQFKSYMWDHQQAMPKNK